MTRLPTVPGFRFKTRIHSYQSHRQRGIRAKSREKDNLDTHRENIPIDRSELQAEKSGCAGPRTGSVSTWAMLIRRVYEADPLACPECGGTMKIIGFIERRQGDVIERILRHCGLWEGHIRTLASARAPPGSSRRATARDELELVVDSEFLESERLAAEDVESPDLQLVFDPEFL